MKILIVEPNRQLSRYLVQLLAEEGYVCDVCRTGAEATAQVEAMSYDLVVLDAASPAHNGVSVCRKLRQLDRLVPILMLSADAAVQDKVSALDAGADDCLTRPFQLDELKARVRALIRRAGGPSDLTLRAGRLTLDFRQRIVMVDGRPIDLTAREFVLLSLLARKIGRVVTRTEILEQVWSTHAEPGTNVIAVHIRHIREKLGAAAGYVETIRGQGFRLTLKEPS